MTRTRYVIASFASPLVALAVPCLLAVSQLYAEGDILPDGSSDDAAMRGAGMFLVVGLPVLYLLAAIYYAAAGHILARMELLRLRTTVLLASAAPWAFVALGVIGLLSNNRTWAPGLAMLAMVGVCMSLFAALGAVAWWYMAVGKSRSDA